MFKKNNQINFLSTIVAKHMVRPILKLHNISYTLAGILASVTEGNVHPKHRILLYKEWFLEHVKESAVVLDVGSNTGLLPRTLANKVQFVYGIEILEDLVNIARQNNDYNNLKFFSGDATLYDYDLINPVSVITLSNVLEHIENRVEFLRKIIQQVRWQNENEMRILVRVPMYDRDWITVYKKDLGIEWRLDKTHFTEYTLESFEEEMRMSGVEILSVKIKFGEIYAVCKAKPLVNRSKLSVSRF